MPTGLGHFILAFTFLIPIIYYTDGKFNKKVAAIFLINNWIGPDSAQAYGFLEDITGIDFHWFIPYMVWAIPLALFFSYFSRFSIKRTEKFITVVDDKRREVNWTNSYLLCLSGGLLHTGLDALFRDNLKFKFLDDVFQPTIPELHHLASYGWDVGALQIIPFILMFIVFIFAVYIVERNFRQLLLFFIIFCCLTLILVLVFGDKIVGEEFEVAVIILSIIFIMIPIFLLLYVEKNVVRHPTPIIERPRLNAELGLKLVSFISLLFSILLLLLGIIVTLNPTFIYSILDVNLELIVAIGIILIAVSIFMILGSIGLIFKNKHARIIIMAAISVTFIFIYPLIIFYYLCQEEVKQLFFNKVGIIKIDGENNGTKI